MACKVLSKEQMKAQIIEWLDSGAVIERVYYVNNRIKRNTFVKNAGECLKWALPYLIY